MLARAFDKNAQHDPTKSLFGLTSSDMIRRTVTGSERREAEVDDRVDSKGTL